MTRPLTEDFQQTPFWWVEAPPEDADPPELPVEAEVLIVGAGFAGLCCALELAEGGVRAVVVEADRLGEGASTRSGAMLTGGQKFVVSGSINHLDAGRQARILEDAGESLQMVQDRVVKYQLDADCVRYGRLILAHVPQHVDRLARWAELLRAHAGSDATLLRRPELQSEIGGNRYHAALLIRDYGGLHPAKYHRGLRDAVRARGGILVPRTRVLGTSRDGNSFKVETTRGTVQAAQIVIATNGTTGRAVPWLRRRVVPVTAYVATTERLPSGMAEAMVPKRRMMSDTQRDLYWMRLSPDGGRLIFGARPRIGETDARTAGIELHRMMCGVWPELSSVRIQFCWTGAVAMTADHIPHMGMHDGIHYALGCNGSGVAMMSYLGHQTASKLLGKQNRRCAFDVDTFPAPPLYNGQPWFVPIVAGWNRARDRIDTALATATRKR